VEDSIVERQKKLQKDEKKIKKTNKFERKELPK
jgi:hypothetical protein